jgi:hypothetical protein
MLTKIERKIEELQHEERYEKLVDDLCIAHKRFIGKLATTALAHLGDVEDVQAAADVVADRLLAHPLWQDVNAADINDIAYAECNRQIDSWY